MTLPVIRPIRQSDLDTLLTFANEVGYGLTTLPKQKEVLEKKIAHSLKSFAKEQDEAKDESYLFVLELPTKEVIGVSGIVSRIATREPFYAYQVLHTHRVCEELNIDRQVPLLHFTHAKRKPTEIGTLFLKKEHRRSSYGRLLSFVRFLFMATFEKCFAPVVIAEMRGISDKNGNSPFYNAIGKHFMEVPFDEANHLRLINPKSITTVFPEYPIYPDLLPPEAKKVIGIPHEDTVAALKLLEKQGFKQSHYIDIFDAGPHVFAPLAEIKAVKTSIQIPVVEIVDTLPDDRKAIVSNTSKNFRALIANYHTSDKKGIVLTQQCARALQVSLQDTIRFLPL